MELILSELFSSNSAKMTSLETVTKLIAKAMVNYEDSKKLMLSYDGNAQDYKDVMIQACQLTNQAEALLELAEMVEGCPEYAQTALASIKNMLRQYEGGVLISSIAGKYLKKWGRSQSTYLIKNPKSKLVKIGKTTDMKNRIQSIQCGAGLKLEVLAIIDSDVERAMHLKFAELREFNEWFRDPNGDIESYFRKLAKKPRN